MKKRLSLILDLLRWSVENDVKTPIIRPSAFFFLCVAALRIRKKNLSAPKRTVFVDFLPTATSLFLIAGFFFIHGSAIAQFPSVHGYWEGDWGGSSPFNIYIEAGKDGAMTATITWSLQYFDYKSEKMVDTYPKEFLKGTWSEKTGLLIFNTIGEEDPHELVAPGYYEMRMDMSGAVMKGFTTTTLMGTYKTEITMNRLRT